MKVNDKIICKKNTQIIRHGGKPVNYFKNKKYTIRHINFESYFFEKTIYYVTADDINVYNGNTRKSENYYGFNLDELYDIFYNTIEVRKLKLDKLKKFH